MSSDKESELSDKIEVDPFAIDPALNPGADRTQEVARLLEALQSNPAVALTGPHGIGKSTVAAQAAQEFAQQHHGIAFHLQLGHGADGYNLDAGLQAKIAALRAGMNLRAELGNLAGDPADSAAGTGTSLPDMIQGLNERAGLGKEPWLVVLDQVENLLRSPCGMMGAVAKAILGADNLRFLLSMSGGAEIDPSNNPLLPGKDVPMQTLGPIDPKKFSEWLDQRFAAAGQEPHGAGRACVDLAGSRPADVIDLAKNVWSVAREEGMLAARTVENVVSEQLSYARESLAGIWNSFTQPEKQAVTDIALRGKPGENAAEAVQSLREKNLVEILPDGRALLDPLLRQWALRPQLRAQLDAATSADAQVRPDHAIGFHFGQAVRAGVAVGARA